MKKNLLFKKTILLNLVIVFALIFTSFKAFSAYFTNFPITIKQPTGETYNVFVSGDEYYNWIHDADGYTIIQHPKTGFYVFAVKSGDGLIASEIVFGKTNPSIARIEKGLKVSGNIIQKQMAEFIRTVNMAPPKIENKKADNIKLNTGILNNLVVFIRFSDESEWTDNLSTYSDMFNNPAGNSMKNYFKEVSYNTLDISSTFYPTTAGTTVVSYRDNNPRSYYQPYNASTNPNGYQGGDGGSQRRDREHSLLVNCVNAVAGDIPTSLNLDFNSDGYVDNVCFIVSGTPGGWASLLWPHRWSLYSQTAYINGKRVYDYNLQIRSMTLSSGNGVLCHEMFHTLGSPDLYHYTSNGIAPVYSWDLMENNANPPQHMGAYMKYRYGGWINSIPEITTAGTYTLNPQTQSSGNCYKIKSPNSTTEYFVLEYRRKMGTFESSVPGSGLIVYRINSNYDGRGNSNGPPDEVYIYRPGGTTTANGNPSNANFSSDVGRVAINNTTDPSGFLANGSAGYLDISLVGTSGNTISFNVGFGTPSIPTLMLPANGATSVALRPTFTWSPFTGANTYALQVSTAMDFATKVIDRTGLISTSFSATSDLNYNTTYYWRVNATTGSGTTNWSNTFAFETLPNVRIDSIVGQMCAGYAFTVFYTAGTSFASNNYFSVQLSDTLGKFTRPLEVGALTSNVSGSIVCQLPDSVPGGSKYRMRIYASNPETFGTDNGKDITVTPMLSPFANGPKEVCEFSSVTYQTSNISNISNKWTVVYGGTLLTKPDSSIVKILWDSAGQGKIKLIKRSIAGCADSINIFININPIPTPQITGNFNVCKNSIEFYSANLSPDTKNIWDVKGGKIISYLSDKMIKVGWDTLGKGSVKLTQIINATGCSSFITKNITISQIPHTDSIAGTMSVCPSSEIVYSTNPAPGTSNQWIPVNGMVIGKNNLDSVMVKWNESGTASIKLIQTLDSTGCKDTLIKSVKINTKPDPSFLGQYQGCSDLLSSYKTAPDSQITNLWNVVNGEIIGLNNLDTVTVKWGAAGIGKIQLTQTFKSTGCSETASLDIEINNQPPKPTIIRQDNNLVSSSDQGNQWFLGNQKIDGEISQIYTPTKDGTYSVEVTVKGCVSEISDNYVFISGDVYDKTQVNDVLSFFPNPTDGVVRFRLLKENNSKITLSIRNVLGLVLLNKEFDFFSLPVESIDISILADGVYFFVFRINEKQFIEKIILKK